MQKHAVVLALFAGVAASAGAQELTWRKDIQPVIEAKCTACHSANQPGYAE